MIPVGYMYKTVCEETDGINNDVVENIFSVSGCISEDFADWINYWKHNGYWLFDSPEVIEELAAEHNIKLTGMTLFFYRASEQEWNIENKEWRSYQPEENFGVNVVEPNKSVIAGYDIVSFSGHVDCECSPLSCNYMAESLSVNKNCLLDNYDDAKKLLENGTFDQCEPGPYRIFEVHCVYRV